MNWYFLSDVKLENTLQKQAKSSNFDEVPGDLFSRKLPNYRNIPELAVGFITRDTKYLK